MAVQFGIAWSSIIKGVGAIAGGPFGCAGGSAATALSTCMLGTPAIPLAALERQAAQWSASGAIDPIANLGRQRIYLFNGYNDAVVARSVGDALASFYRHYQNTDKANLFYQTAIGAGHAQVTLNHGGACNANSGEYINNCGYDQAGIILQHIYGALLPPNREALTGKIVSFRQGDFTGPDEPNDDSLADTGFAFVPAPCAAQKACRVHVALHAVCNPQTAWDRITSGLPVTTLGPTPTASLCCIRRPHR